MGALGWSVVGASSLIQPVRDSGYGSRRNPAHPFPCPLHVPKWSSLGSFGRTSIVDIFHSTLYLLLTSYSWHHIHFTFSFLKRFIVVSIWTVKGQKRREWQKNLPTLGSLPQIATRAAMGPDQSQDLALHLDLPYGACAILCCFPSCINRVLDRKYSSQDLTWHSYGMPVSEGAPQCWPFTFLFQELQVTPYDRTEFNFILNPIKPELTLISI